MGLTPWSGQLQSEQRWLLTGKTISEGFLLQID